MSANLNPNANLASAVIGFNESTGQMIVHSQSGFAKIEQGSTLLAGIYFVLAEDSFDENTQAQATVCYPRLDTKPPASYIPLVSTNILAAASGSPIDSDGKTILQVVGWSIQTMSRGPDAVPFVLNVYQNNPRYIAPEVGPTVEGGGGPSGILESETKMASDSLHRTTDGQLVKGYTTPDVEIDPGPWGQTKTLVWYPFNTNQQPVTLIRGTVNITPASGEPKLRTYSVAIQNRIQQPDGVRGPDPSAADVHVVGIVNYGIGGAQFTAEISFRNGTSFTLPASYWDISAFIEPIPDMSLPFGAMYPDSTSGEKTVQLYCSAALGSRQGGAVLPTRDFYTRIEDGYATPPVTTREIPQSAVSVTFYASTDFASIDFTGQWLGYADMVIGTVEIKRGVKNPVPPGAFKLQYFPNSAPDPGTLLAESWDLYL